MPLHGKLAFSPAHFEVLKLPPPQPGFVLVASDPETSFEIHLVFDADSAAKIGAAMMSPSLIVADRLPGSAGI